jgi:hypothetical protein
MTEHEFPLPNGRSWVVRAFEYPTGEDARSVWEAIEEASRGTKGNFSIWRSTNPARTIHLVVVCGYAEHLPSIHGNPYELGVKEAHLFALRRARVGADAEAAGIREHFEQEMRYGEDSVVTIDPETGGTKPYRRK